MTFPVTYLKAKPKTHYPRRHHHRTLFITHPKELGKGIGSDEVEWSVHTPFLASDKYANLRTSKSESSRGDHKNPKNAGMEYLLLREKINAGQRSNVVSGEGNGSEGKGQEQEVPSTSGMECRRLPRRWNTIKPH